ncbi:hypothetical protein CDQ84_10695 [Clostridium thermosuccinogenes]|uniref:Uncharacterized protein n=1 Tax=Clostridium thermosuccinogenes TaxID=84032 RepID=A0A2K2FIK5_9CLOT|nr:hypothetical protein [Pseudoclostridium thermosuccinogenes]AUS95203.1 hypothetical protein CDO33_01305 [Pseudoclostridium thermosuccinogenes]PNT91581.1 hypothetical protein CDQ83_17565 [Pseudoclostridium thermosuccinogenes]PNT96761.1 hypothetical protein CDQ85_10540 [Pseudoclostridium thermosuccinogenes]PNT98598.1 hypothetical protein CDQ84_10695 [Pseudoclostridium thermosuccinogenes]
MTYESLLEMKEKLDKAEGIYRHITSLRKILERRSSIKLIGICAYFDDELEDMLYTDLPEEAINYFMEEIVKKEIDRLKKEFATL